MRMRIQRLIGTSALVIIVATGAGCSAAADDSTVSTPGPSQAPQVPATIPSDPVAALAAAKAHLGTESARFAQDTEPDMLDFTGIVNAETKNWEIHGKEYAVRRIGTDLYVRASGKALKSLLVSPTTIDRLAAGAWARTRLPNGRELSTVFNDRFPWNLTNPAIRATGITQTGDRSFSGTVSVTVGKNGSRPQTRKLPVTVDLDDRGRITTVGLSADPASPDRRTYFTFSDFGVRADITAPPPADVVEEDNPSFLADLGL
jgi:hypothetical protein